MVIFTKTIVIFDKIIVNYLFLMNKTSLKLKKAY